MASEVTGTESGGETTEAETAMEPVGKETKEQMDTSGGSAISPLWADTKEGRTGGADTGTISCSRAERRRQSF